MNRKNNGMVGARMLIARRVGAVVVDGHEMREAADERGQPWAIVKKKNISHSP